MQSSTAELTIKVDTDHSVSALFQIPGDAWACFILAHGAGAGMRHSFMSDVADDLAARGIATLRYQFPYMERGSRRPDPPALCHATVRAAVSEAALRAPKLPIIAGGKSFGGRMTSQAQALSPLAGVLGLAFLGFPLHPANKPSDARAKHLFDVRIPMLFVQGTRDELAEMSLLQPLAQQLGKYATLECVQDADHSFHVPARTGRKDPQVRAEMLDTLAAWTRTLLPHSQ